MTVKQTFVANEDFTVTMGVFTDKDENGNLNVNNVVIGVENVGNMKYTLGVDIGIEAKM